MNIDEFQAIFRGAAFAILFVVVLSVIGILRSTSDKKNKSGSYHEGGTGSGWDDDDGDAGFGGSGWNSDNDGADDSGWFYGGDGREDASKQFEDGK